MVLSEALHFFLLSPVTRSPDWQRALTNSRQMKDATMQNKQQSATSYGLLILELR